MSIARLGAGDGTPDRAGSPSQGERRPLRCISLPDLFCWPLALCCSARRKPSLATSASRFCPCGTFASRRRGRCIGRGPASSLPMHRRARPHPANSTSSSRDSRRPLPICSSWSVSPGFRDSPRCRSTFGGTNGLRTIGSSASRPAHVASSAPSCILRSWTWVCVALVSDDFGLTTVCRSASRKYQQQSGAVQRTQTAISGYRSLKSGFPNIDGMRPSRNKSNCALAPTVCPASLFRGTIASAATCQVTGAVVNVLLSQLIWNCLTR